MCGSPQRSFFSYPLLAVSYSEQLNVVFNWLFNAQPSINYYGTRL
jgi:hypothetical protein